MTTLIGVVTAAVLFGVFTIVRAGDRGCSGGCVGCTRNGACETEGGRKP